MSIFSTHTVVLIEDFHLETFIGELEPERNQPQVVSVSIACSLRKPDVPDDNLANSFDYVPIVEEVRTRAVRHKRRLIETFAEEIAEICFANSLVKATTVSVRKPHKFPAISAVGTQRTFERR